MLKIKYRLQKNYRENDIGGLILLLILILMKI